VIVEKLVELPVDRIVHHYQVCCSVLCCVVVCCGELQCVAPGRSKFGQDRTLLPGVLQCVAMCCNVLQCVAVCCNVLPIDRIVDHYQVNCSVLQCVAVC